MRRSCELPPRRRALRASLKRACLAIGVVELARMTGRWCSSAHGFLRRGPIVLCSDRHLDRVGDGRMQRRIGRGTEGGTQPDPGVVGDFAAFSVFGCEMILDAPLDIL